jgi:3-phosphoshikimate 1-carboxyvinyltransferase
MEVKIYPAQVAGSIVVPASKSVMQRACAAAYLHKGTTRLFNAGISNDDKAALAIIQSLGATVLFKDDCIEITGAADTEKDNFEINCGESGLSLRMFTSIAALKKNTVTISGHGSLVTRPINFFFEVLPKLGVSITGNDNKLPIAIKGPIQPNEIEVDGSLSSQFITGLLFAFANSGLENTTLQVKGLTSKPYVDVTIKVMQDFGYNVINQNYERFIVSKSNKADSIISYTVESDWSSASFLLVAAAIAGNLTLKGLDVFSTQADKAMLQVLQQVGCFLSINESYIEVKKNKLNGFVFDATQCPDLFPPLVALAAHCTGKSVIYGVHRLAAKESDRAVALQQEFGKMGITITLQEDDAMIIKGGTIKPATVHSHNDHRIAMAAAVAALPMQQGFITIENAEAVGKSYPNFYEDLKKICTNTNH